MYLDDQGNVYDYFNGQDDLKNKIVRFIGIQLKELKRIICVLCVFSLSGLLW